MWALPGAKIRPSWTILVPRRPKCDCPRVREVDFATLPVLDAANRGIEDLTGLEAATGLGGLFLDRNQITDIAPLSELGSVLALSLAHNMVEDLAPLAGMRSLRYLALDGNSLDDNSLRDLPPLPRYLRHLCLSDNSISDIAPLANASTVQC